MPNIFSLSCICLNSALHSISLIFAKLPEVYSFLNPIVDVILVIPVLFFSLSPCLVGCCKFSMKF